MSDKTNFIFDGVYLMYLVLGFLGGLLGLLGIGHVPPISKTQIVSTLLAGMVFGMFLPNPMSALVLKIIGWELPIEVKYLLALFFGIWGMFIVPGLIVIGRAFSAKPIETINSLRGKNPLPETKDEKTNG